MSSAPHIRWMIRRDMPEVLEIERLSFPFPWSEDDFIRELRERICIGMVAEVDEIVAGFMVYQLHKSRLFVTNFAVHPDYRRQGIGRAMVAKLVSKLSRQRRDKIAWLVGENNLDAHLFLRACGFKAREIVSGFYDDGQDGYMFHWRLPREVHSDAAQNH